MRLNKDFLVFDFRAITTKVKFLAKGKKLRYQGRTGEV